MSVPVPGREPAVRRELRELVPGLGPQQVLDIMNGALVGTMSEKLGMRLTAISPDEVVATMPVEGNLQPAGLLHGGGSIALAETLGSLGAIVHAVEIHGVGASAVGTNVTATHLRSATHGMITGHAECLHRGRRTAFYRIEIRDDEDRLLCAATVDNQVLPPRSR